jgi:hypothetical protein
LSKVHSTHSIYERTTRLPDEIKAFALRQAAIADAGSARSAHHRG